MDMPMPFGRSNKSMSVYYVNKVFYLLESDADFLSKFRGNVDEALKGFRLTPDEVAAIKGGDVESLYRMGTHAFLLNVLARHNLCGVNRDNYLARIKNLGKKRLPRKV